MSGAGNEQHRETAEPGAAALPSAWAGFVRIRCMKTRTSVVLLLLLAATSTFAESESRVVYLANEGVAVFHNQTTLLFDPIFITKDAYYAAVPDDVRDAIISGAEPYTDIAAVFVSHYHLDHFEPAEMLRLMMQHEKTELYAPKQAVDAMREVAHSEHADIFSRISVLDLAYGDEPKSIQAGNLKVQGFYVPHSGWPKTSSDIENIAFRVTIDDVATVVHLGDADTDKAHFTAHQHHWQERAVASGWHSCSEQVSTTREYPRRTARIRPVYQTRRDAAFTLNAGVSYGPAQRSRAFGLSENSHRIP